MTDDQHDEIMQGQILASVNQDREKDRQRLFGSTQLNPNIQRGNLPWSDVSSLELTYQTARKQLKRAQRALVVAMICALLTTLIAAVTNLYRTFHAQPPQTVFDVPYIIYVETISPEMKAYCQKDSNCQDVLLSSDLPLRDDVNEGGQQ